MAGENGGLGVEVDLLGDPLMPLKDPRGRPAFAKSKENQLLVISLRGAGWSQEEIAAFMRCDPKTLRRHFSRELDHGATFLDGLAVQVLVRKMMEGNVGAAKAVRELTAARAPKAKGDGKPKPAPAPLGKKDRQKLEAHDMPAGWGDLLQGKTH